MKFVCSTKGEIDDVEATNLFFSYKISLHRRIPLEDTSCPQCRALIETNLHISMECPYPIKVWELAGFDLGDWRPWLTSWESWFGALLEEQEGDLEAVVMLLWGLCQALHDFMFEGEVQTVQQLVVGVFTFWEQFKLA